jgi:orotate phosphoribosyltransferase
MKWDQESFNDFIKNQNVIGFFEKPLKLKSGRLSYWYVNWRNITSDVFLLDRLTDYIISYTDYLGLKPRCFYGVPEGGTKLGIITQFKWAKRQKNYHSESYPLPMGRGKQKKHGDPKDKSFLCIPEGDIIILEDVTTTGGSLINTIQSLKELNVNIVATIGLTNRNELRDDGKTVKEMISQLDIQYYAMSNAIDILPSLDMTKEIAYQIKDYFRKYGTKEIKLIL